MRSSKQERQAIVDYMASEAPDETVEHLEKVYSERVAVLHDIWDVHTDHGRWWVITNPTNLYLQEQFPSMDIALTFHVGLCLRMWFHRDSAPIKSEIELFTACWRSFQQAGEAIKYAEETEDFQAIGMRCRESLITLVKSAWITVEFDEDSEPPKASDFRAWSQLIAESIAAGSSNAHQRSLLKSCAESAWKYVNWLVHAANATVYDAEIALQSTELVLSAFTTAWTHFALGDADRCPKCGSYRLSLERGYPPDKPELTYKRPICTICGWVGDPILLSTTLRVPQEYTSKPEGECVFVEVPLHGPKPPKPSV
jgi:hypothetical protein